jgi:hypothetical protein
VTLFLELVVLIVLGLGLWALFDDLTAPTEPPPTEHTTMMNTSKPRVTEEHIQLLIAAGTLIRDGIPGSVLTLGMNMKWAKNPSDMTDEEILLFIREETEAFLASLAELTMMIVMAKAVKLAVDTGAPRPTSAEIKARILTAIENNRANEGNATRAVDDLIASLKKASA